MVGFLCLLAATFLRRIIIIRTFLWRAALLALLAQGGCWKVVEIGAGIGGDAHSVDRWNLQVRYLLGAAVVWLVWSVLLLIVIQKAKKREKLP